jgi:hypothetical protein
MSSAVPGLYSSSLVINYFMTGLLEGSMAEPVSYCALCLIKKCPSLMVPPMKKEQQRLQNSDVIVEI